MTRRTQPLYRDTNDRMIAGVCSGLGHYFDIDTTLVRVVFVVFTLIGGGGILAYLLLAIILDPAPLPLPAIEAPPPPVPPVDRVEPPATADTGPELVEPSRDEPAVAAPAVDESEGVDEPGSAP